MIWLGSPCVAQRVCPIPQVPRRALPSSVFSARFPRRPFAFTTSASLSPSRTAIPAESYPLYDVRPGLSGYAQVNGRNSISWTHKFELDCEYVEKITFLGDLKILFQTIGKAFLKQEGISSDTSDTMEDFDGTN